MNKKIKYIRIGLENVEIIDIPIKDVLKWSYNKKTKEAKIIISKRIKNKTYPSYGKLRQNIFKRLTDFNDIVDVTFLDVKKSEIANFFVVWEEKCECNNLYQTYKYKNGNLIINIKKRNYSLSNLLML